MDPKLKTTVEQALDTPRTGVRADALPGRLDALERQLARYPYVNVIPAGVLLDVNALKARLERRSFHPGTPPLAP